MAGVLAEALRLRKLGLAVHWLAPKSKAPIANGWATAPVMTEAQLRARLTPMQYDVTQVSKHAYDSVI